jgi:predicted O-linked N-acetylglucosamine transferase (SPINDLY family)
MNPQWLESAKQHHSAGRLDKAEALYRKVLLSRPNHPDALHLLGLLHYQAGRFDAAAEMLRRAASANPTSAECRFNLALALLALGRWDDAIAALRDALSLRPSYPQAYNSLGTALQQKGQLTEAVEAYRQAVALRPEVAGFWSNLGIALHGQGNPQEAVEAFRRAIALKPDFAEAHNNLGNALWASRRYTEAAQACREAIRLRPDLADAYNNLGNIFHSQGLLDESIAASQRALAMGCASAFNNLAKAFHSAGRIDEALALCDRVLATHPDDIVAHSNRVYTVHCHPDFDAHAILRELRLWNERHAKPLRQHVQPHTNDRSPDRRLKIGYVSPDFRAHAVGRFLVPLLGAHDHSQVEVCCYADVPAPDDTTGRLQSCADLWRKTCGISDEQLAEQIRRDRIDILVDLALHTAGNRLLVFARKPAPVQVTYLAYCSSSGLDTIDYRLSDPYIDPAGMDETCYSEKTIRLPQTYWCYEPILPELQPNDLPALKNGRVTFGCLNNYGKVSSATWSAWRRLLAAMPEARLIIHSAMGSHRDRALQDIPNPQRITFIAMVPAREYFEQYHQIDIALDPFPYGGGTTTCDALWMGVPVITLHGRTGVGRAGVSLLSNAGLPQLIAQDPDQYVQIARNLAADLPRLAQLRSTLRQQMEKSPLMDAPRFARNVESAYRQMWRQWCQPRSP